MIWMAHINKNKGDQVMEYEAKSGVEHKICV